jgi:ATP/ADP translocase
MKHSRFIMILDVLLLLAGTATTLFAQWEPDVRLTYNDSSSGTSYNNAWCVAATGNTVHVVLTCPPGTDPGSVLQF